MTTPKWMLGLLAVAALFVAQVDNEDGCDNNKCPSSSIDKVEEE